MEKLATIGEMIASEVGQTRAANGKPRLRIEPGKAPVTHGKLNEMTSNAKPYGGTIFRWGIFALLNGSGYVICGFKDPGCKEHVRTQHIVRLHMGLNEVETKNSRYTLDHMDRERAAAVANHSQLCAIV